MAVPKALLDTLARFGLLESALEWREGARGRLESTRRSAMIRRARFRSIRQEARSTPVEPSVGVSTDPTPTGPKVWVIDDGRPANASIRPELRPIDAMEEHTEAVIEAASRAGLEWRRLPSWSRDRRRVAVLAGDDAVVEAALARSGLSVEASDGQLEPAAPTGQRQMHLGGGWLVGAVSAADGRGNGVIGRRHHCRVERWEPEQSAATPEVATGSDWNPVVDPGDPDRSAAAIDRAWEQHLSRTRHRLDVVVTWVDASDRRWQADLAAARAADSVERHPLSANSGRFLDRGELRHTLRSLHRWGDAFGTIHLVTAGHVPEWLDVAHPRIRLVTHGEIFEGLDALPTFNSHAIESRLHHIDGLGEHFLYVNDDVQLLRRATVEQFVTPAGRTRFFPARARIGLGPAHPAVPPVDAAARTGRDLLARRLGRVPTQRLAHTPHALQRSLLSEIEAEFGPEVERTSTSRFRSPDDLALASSFHHWYGLAIGRCELGELESRYLDLGEPNLGGRLRSLRADPSIDVVCLNDTTGADTERIERHLRTHWNEVLPSPAPWEIA